MNWLTAVKLDPREQRIAFEEIMLAVRQARERIERLEQAIREAVPDWTLVPVVEAPRGTFGPSIDLRRTRHAPIPRDS